MTLAGAVCDEVTLYPESFITQLIARCSIPEAKMFWNCNPDSPYHYINKNYLQNDKLIGIVKRFHFLMEDNPSLDEQYKKDIKQLYSGIWYQRFILGLWVLAEGVIYTEFSEELHCINGSDIPLLNVYHIGCDYGITNPHVYLKVGINMQHGQPHFYVLEEYYNNKTEGKPKTDTLFLEDYKIFIDSINIQSCIIDPSATSLINLFKINNINVKQANNAVIDGINNVSAMIKQNRIHIVKDKCPNLIKEFAAYSWDTKAQLLGDDVPLKKNDHALDALRYVINTLYPVKRAIGNINLRGK